MAPPASKPISSFRVLMVEDQQQMRQIIRESLYRLGIRQVVMTAHAEEALKAMRVGSFDLVLCDYNLNANNLLAFSYTGRNDINDGKVGIPAGTGNYDVYRQRSENLGKLFLVRYQKIFSPTLVNELNANYSTRPLNNSIADADLTEIDAIFDEAMPTFANRALDLGWRFLPVDEPNLQRLEGKIGRAHV